MNKNHIVIVENGKQVGDLLLDVLVETGVLNESRHKILTSQMMIAEAEDASTFVTYKGHRIDRVTFHAVYSNINRFSTPEQILIGLGFTPKEIGDIKKGSRRKAVARMVIEFNRNADPREDHVQYPLLKDRVREYTREARQEAGWDDATEDDIDGGRRGATNKTTRVTQKINSQDLLSGEFYSDRTRIPPTRWAGWLRFWNRRKTSVRPDATGRRWKKTFVLGYQVERNVIYEVWYNSLDSTFTIHDRGGVEMSGRMKSMVEAIRNLIRQITQESDSDADFFTGNTPDAKQLSASVTRALTQSADSRAEELQRADMNEFKRERIARMKIHRRREEAKTAAKDRLNRARDFLDTNDYTSSDEEWDKAEKRQNRDVAKTWKNASQKTKQFLSSKNLGVEDIKLILKTGKKMAYSDLVALARRELKINKTMAEEIVKDVGRLFPNDFEYFKQFTDYDWSVFDGDSSNKDSYRSQNQKDVDYDSRSKSRMAKNKKSMGSHGMTADEKMRKDADDSAEERAKQLSLDLERSIKRNSKKKINESESFNLFEQEDPVGALDELIADEVDNRSYDNEIRKIRDQAERSPYTKQALGQNILGEINTYEETRVRHSFLGGWLDNTITKGSIRNIFSGRKIKLPTDKPSVFRRAKMAFTGQRYRADFVIGWTINDRINLEIWYITEPNPAYDPTNPNSSPMVASFYVFDVTSATLVRRFIPHYRNALQVVMGKLSPLL